MCPYLDANRSECAAYHNLQHLGQALGLCADRYDQCPVYRKFAALLAARPAHDAPLRAAS